VNSRARPSLGFFFSPERSLIFLSFHETPAHPSALFIEYFSRQQLESLRAEEGIVMATANGKARKILVTPMRVTLPVSVACDLDKFQRALANVAAIVRTMHLAGGLPRPREFVIDPASLEAKEAAAEQ
jgi:hypothetical protein